MALASDIMKSGFSAGQARGVQGIANAAIAAAGTTQGTATAITQSTVAVTSGTGGVIIPNAEINDEVAICNLTSASITVYPPTSGQINALSANTGFLLGQNTAVKVKKFSSTRWMAFLSA